MSIVQRAIRLPYNFILRYASPSIKRFFWDREFASGKWNFIDDTAGDSSYPYLEKYCDGGSILDLGCGPGNTANELAASAYCEYVGVDVSQVALEKARQRTERTRRSDKNRFVSGDMLTFVPSRQFDVILLRESVYHVAMGELKKMFDRYSQYLTENGAFIVKLVTDNRYTSKARVRIIESEFEILEKGEHARDGSTVLVFRTTRARKNTKPVAGHEDAVPSDLGS